MNVNLYILILAGISLAFYLMYPADSTFLFSVMKTDLSFTSLLDLVITNGLASAGALLTAAAFASVLLTLFGAAAVLPILFNVAVFFIIPNLFLLPTHMLMSGDALGLPLELRIVIIFFMNVLLVMTAIEYWR